MAEDIPFISKADLDAAMQTTTADDLRLAIALDAACDAVRTYMTQRINRVDNETITFDGNDKNSLRLPERPVRAVDTVKEDGVTLTAGTHYFLRRDRLWKVDEWDVWTKGRNNIEVTYDHGYDVTGTLDMVVPADIRWVALQLASRAWVVMAAPPPSPNVQSETMGSYSYTSKQTAAAAVSLSGDDAIALRAILDMYIVNHGRPQ